jgi:hypothetical protein
LERRSTSSVSSAILDGRDPHAAPVGGTEVEQIAADGVAPGPDRQHRHRHPIVEERLKRTLLGDVVLGVAAAGENGRIGIGIVVVPSRPQLDRQRPVGCRHARAGVLDERMVQPRRLFEFELVDQELDARMRHDPDGLVRPARDECCVHGPVS